MNMDAHGSQQIDLNTPMEPLPEMISSRGPIRLSVVAYSDLCVTFSR